MEFGNSSELNLNLDRLETALVELKLVETAFAVSKLVETGCVASKLVESSFEVELDFSGAVSTFSFSCSFGSVSEPCRDRTSLSLFVSHLDFLIGL